MPVWLMEQTEGLLQVHMIAVMHNRCHTGFHVHAATCEQFFVQVCLFTCF